MSWEDPRAERRGTSDRGVTVAKCIHMAWLWVSTFLSLHSYLFANPCLHRSVPFLSWSLAPRSLLTSLCPSCLDLPPVTLSHHEDTARASIKASNIKSHQSRGEKKKKKGGPGANIKEVGGGDAQGPPRLTSTNWLAIPTRLILLRFSHQCPCHCHTMSAKESGHQRKLWRIIGPRERPRARLLFDVFCTCLFL